MIVEYYPESDMLYIQLRTGVSAVSEEVFPGIVLDFDDRGQLIGVEIEDASKRLDITSLEVRSLPLTQLLWREPVSETKERP